MKKNEYVSPEMEIVEVKAEPFMTESFGGGIPDQEGPDTPGGGIID